MLIISGALGVISGVVTFLKVAKNVYYLPLTLVTSTVLTFLILASLFQVMSGADLLYAKHVWDSDHFHITTFMTIFMISVNSYVINTFLDLCIAFRYFITSIVLNTSAKSKSRTVIYILSTVICLSYLTM